MKRNEEDDGYGVLISERANGGEDIDGDAEN
jgi:hypothetical protein